MAPPSTEGLHVHVFATAAQAISAAASDVALELRRLIRERGRAVGIFDGALLPEEFFTALTAEPELDWTQVIVFQAAELLGTDDLRRFLTNHFIMRVPIIEFHAIRGDAANPRAAASNFADRLAAKPADFAVLGVDDNGRLGLLPPQESDSAEHESTGIVEVESGGALALTTSALISCPLLFVVGKGSRHQIVNRHPNAHLYQ
jgi:6-phosphogluconolactonase/glucosamine-6-phosphate isomerase/deaminase